MDDKPIMTSINLSTTLYVGGVGPGNYSTIKSAIDNASNGDTVFVYNGTYNERFAIEKILNLRGENRDNTIISGDGKYNVIKIKSDWVNISGFTIQNSGTNSANQNAGIYGYIQYNCNISNNNIINNTYGIYFYVTGNSTFCNNNIMDNSVGIDVLGKYNTIVSCFFKSNSGTGLNLRNVKYITISNNIFINDGIWIWPLTDFKTDGNIITNNTVNNKPLVYLEGGDNITLDYSIGQVLLANCSNITILNQDFSNNDGGIILRNSDYCIIKNSTINYNCKGGIFFTDSNFNTIIGNTISYTNYGIWFENSKYNEINGNNFTELEEFSFFLARFSENNIIHGNFFNNSEDGIKFTFSSNGNIVTENSIQNIDGYGISIQHTNSLLIDKNIIDNCIIGIFGWQSHYHEIINNIITNSPYSGIQGSYFNDNFIFNNSIINDINGIILTDCHRNNIINNDIWNNSDFGVKMTFSSQNNSIYHNNFINNTNHSNSLENNQWDDGYPSGGNCWDDYTGDDLYKGPNQDIPGADGIGDIPYTFDYNNTDNYPFINPNGWINNPPTTPLKPDGPTKGKPEIEYYYNTSSTDDNSINLFYQWDWDDGTDLDWYGPYSSGEICTRSHSWEFEGNYSIRVKAKDQYGLESDWSESLNVTIIYMPPIADANGPYEGTTDNPIQLDGSGSYDQDGYILTYDWDFGDGETGTGVNPTHHFYSYGNYTITLTVTDDDGLTDVDTTYAVVGHGNPPIVQLNYPDGGEILEDTITVEWMAFDEEDGNDLPIYLYYFDDNNDWYQINGILENDGEYSWDTNSVPDGEYRILVETLDSDNNLAHDSSDWFTIKNHDEPPENNPPNEPIITGPTEGKYDTEYEYNFVTTDPDGDDIYYLVDWGDDNSSGWIGPEDSGQSIDLTHIWTEEGYYEIRAKCKDVFGDESDWSILEIAMPKSISNYIKNNITIEIQGGLGLKIIITNTGDNDIQDLELTITMDAPWMFLSGGGISTTIDIVSGVEETITTGFFLGFGPFEVTVNLLDITETRIGFLIGPFVILY